MADTRARFSFAGPRGRISDDHFQRAIGASSLFALFRQMLFLELLEEVFAGHLFGDTVFEALSVTFFFRGGEFFLDEGFEAVKLESIFISFSIKTRLP